MRILLENIHVPICCHECPSATDIPDPPVCRSVNKPIDKNYYYNCRPKWCPIIVHEMVVCAECKYAHMTISGECKYCDLMKDEEDNYIRLYYPEDYFCGGGVLGDGE